MGDAITLYDKYKNNLGVVIPTAIITTVVLIILFIILLSFFMEKVEFILSRILSYFTWVGTGVKKTALSKDLRSRVLRVSKEISGELRELMPYDLKVVWVKDADKDSFVNKNQIVLRMGQSKNPQRNFVFAMAEYLKKGLIPKSREYIDKKVMEATDLAVLRKAILISYSEAMEYFNDSILSPILDTDQEIKEFLSNLLNLDRNGMLINVLIREFMEKGYQIWPEIPDDCLKQESKEFLRFLNNIATREPGEDVPLVFDGAYFKVAVGLIASSITLGQLGLKHYIRKSMKQLDRGIETIYLFSKGETKVNIASAVAEIIKTKDIRIKRVTHNFYKHKNTSGKIEKGLCICLKTTDINNEEEEAV